MKKTFEKIADSGPNIPLWNLVDFADPDAIHRISTADVNQFKTAVQALAIRSMYSIFKLSNVYEQFSKIHCPIMGRDSKKMCCACLLIISFVPDDTTGRNDLPEAYMTGKKHIKR